MHVRAKFPGAIGAFAIALSTPNLTAQLTWQPIATASAPAARWGHAMTRWGITFGGRDGSQAFADTWVFYGQVGWQPMPTTQSPSPRHGHAMDMALYDTLMFGGADANGVRNGETWMFTTNWMNVPIGSAFTSSWTQLSPAHAPSARAGHALAYDSQTSSVAVLFGGRTDSGLSNETWRFDGTDWQQVTTTLSPPAREGHQLLPYGHDWLLFGGNDDTQVFDDAWLFDGTTWQPLPSMPFAATECAGVLLGFERRRQVFVGGSDAGGQVQTAVYERGLDNGTWFAQPTAGAMTARAGATVIDEYVSWPYDAMTTVLFGGRDAQGNALGDTWRLVPANLPSRETLGSGCGPGAWSTTGGPNLFLPRVILGNTGQLGTFTHTPSTLTAIGLQLGQVAAPQACQIAIVPEAVWLGVSDPVTGGFGVDLAIPFAEPLRGVKLSMQTAAIEATSPLGFALSALGVIGLGD
ncbi:MAG: hypothetical protein KDE27_22875 [Planctomycetes bacterium]|nr:hypothetical protein [Planctomycetota bacterium]